MFSIAAINDTDSREQWEPLAPTKEAQEFHLTQTYHNGLLKLQTKEFDRAQELLESVLRDPLISSPEVDHDVSDSHLLQLRFLALKNLANVFLQQGPENYDGAIRCYMQAVEIDTKDSVVWNQLGTLSCSMGLLSVSRWAFEQGLLCSPNNWNCMEKLLEVLIAIGDEVACLSVAQLILRHWPSHARALHVKNTIEESEPVQFSPKGIDKLEPIHSRLKFPIKRKAIDEDNEESRASKKLCDEIDCLLPEVSWLALINAIMKILGPLNDCRSGTDIQSAYRSGDIKLNIRLPCSIGVDMNFSAKKEEFTVERETMQRCNVGRTSDCNERESSCNDEHPHERRSTRLESLRSRKPGKEDFEFSNSKDLSNGVLSCVQSFIVDAKLRTNSEHGACFETSINAPSFQDNERDSVSGFIKCMSSNNYGAYHVGHLLLEHMAVEDSPYKDSFPQFLELEKVTRSWGQNRTPECSLFLAELYYDTGSALLDDVQVAVYMSEASYHICKVLEQVALTHPLQLMKASYEHSLVSVRGSLDNKGSSEDFSSQHLSVINEKSFWVRYFWLSGRLSIMDGNMEKAYQELCLSLSFLEKIETRDNSSPSIFLRHLKMNKQLTVFQILYEIRMLKVECLLDQSVDDLIQREMYVDCISLLAPLLLAAEDFHVIPLVVTSKNNKQFIYTELSALNILIKACEMEKQKDVDILLNCHQRKLRLLMFIAGVNKCEPFQQMFELEEFLSYDLCGKDLSFKDWDDCLAAEISAISHCAIQLKNQLDQFSDLSGTRISSIGVSEVQSLILKFMSHIATSSLCKRSSGSPLTDGFDQNPNHFVDACIAFCKLHHLVTSSVKSQVDLIGTMHDLLAEHGLCCAGGVNGEEGLFLKFAIKHLLILDMKLKSIMNMPTGNVIHTNDLDHSYSKSDEIHKDEVRLATLDSDLHMFSVSGQLKENATKAVHTESQLQRDDTVTCYKCSSSEACKNIEEQENCKFSEDGVELTEDEREELELSIDNALDQCFFCLYGLNLRSDSSYEDDLVEHKNTSRGDYQTKEQCADVFQYILPYAKASNRNGLVKLRRVLRAIRKHFPEPPESVLVRNVVDNFLDDPGICEDKLSEAAGCEGFLESITSFLFPSNGGAQEHRESMTLGSESYYEVYSNLYYILASSEETNATDKWTGFVLTREGEEFVQQNANLFKYDLLYNPIRFESWQRLANIYDEDVDLLLNDGSKHINVTGWRKNITLSQRVKASRRRSRRCLLMSLALAKTPSQQCEIHELLALVYYDSLQNVVPFYDQRSVVPTKDAAWTLCCENALRHFKKAFLHKQDWSYAFYMGKLCEKLGYSNETSLSYYEKAIALNPSAVDPVYRMHASRIKFLSKLGRNNLEALQILSDYSFSEDVKNVTTKVLRKLSSDVSLNCEDGKNSDIGTSEKLDEVWHMLYKDCLSALETCIEGDLKHFHKARYMLARGFYKRRLTGDLERAKEELSFCFKSSRSSFTINMWEIDGSAKKGRRKTAGFSGNRKILEVNLPESSRKFITCIRKYLMFYLELLQETGDIATLDRALLSMRADKRFSLCIEDLVPMALGRFIWALVSSMQRDDIVPFDSTSKPNFQLEKMFSLFMDQSNQWLEILSLPEICNPEMSENSLYGYLHQYIALLERNGKLETLEAINEKIRKRSKNPKVSNNSCSKVYRHASIAWFRHIVVNLALITLSESTALTSNSSDCWESTSLCIDINVSEFWDTSSEDGGPHFELLKSKWYPVLSRLSRVAIRKASDENLEVASTLLRSSYSFYRESSCASLPSGVNLYLTPRLSPDTLPTLDTTETVDVSLPRKLLLWAYTLLHGRYANISTVVKHCEENMKSKPRKGANTSPLAMNPSTQSVTAHLGSGKEVAVHCINKECETTPYTGQSLTRASSNLSFTSPSKEGCTKIASDPES